MSIGWIAEDIAEITGTVIGTYDFPGNIIRKTSAFHGHTSLSPNRIYGTSSSASLLSTYSLLAFEKASAKYQSQMYSIADEVSIRLKECQACELSLITMSLDDGITSGTIRYVVAQLIQFFQSKKDAHYKLQHTIQTECSLSNASHKDYKPDQNEIDDTLISAIYTNTMVSLVTCDPWRDRFWRIEDDLKRVNLILRHDKVDVVELFQVLCNLRSSYVKCDNCGNTLFATSTGKVFPFCTNCYMRREE